MLIVYDMIGYDVLSQSLSSWRYLTSDELCYVLLEDQEEQEEQIAGSIKLFCSLVHIAAYESCISWYKRVTKEVLTIIALSAIIHLNGFHSSGNVFLLLLNFSFNKSNSFCLVLCCPICPVLICLVLSCHVLQCRALACVVFSAAVESS